MKLLKVISAAAFCACTVSLVPGCGTVHRQDASSLQHATQFPKPPAGYAGVYIFRSDGLAANLTKAALNLDFANRSIYIDGHYIGDSDSSVFYYRLVRPGLHKFQTESVVSENTLVIDAKAGKNYFVEQKQYPGLLSNSVVMEKVKEQEAMAVIKELTLAKNADDKTKNLPDADYSDGKGSIPAFKE